MDPKFRSSFIPKKPLSTRTERIKLHRSFDIVQAGSAFFFVIALIISGSLFGYKYVLDQNVNSKGTELITVKEQLDLDRVQEFKDLSFRLKSAETLVGRHIAISKFFTVLEANTLHSIQFINFGYITEDRELKVSLEGVTKDFNAIVLQKQAFMKNDLLKEVTFSDFEINEDDDPFDGEDTSTIAFTFSAVIDPTLIAYTPLYE